MAKIIEPDNWLYTPDGVYNHTPERSAEAWKAALGVLEETLKTNAFDKVVLVMGYPASGKSTWVKNHAEEWCIYFVDADLLSETVRSRVIKTIRKLTPISISALFLDTDLKICHKRNDQRRSDRIIPQNAYQTMRSRFAFPSTNEGFDHIQIKRNYSL